MITAKRAFIFTLLALCACSKHEANPPVTVSVNGHSLSVELAITDSEKQKGLKNRKNLANDHGMLLILKKPSDVCVWMEDTRIPLSAAFLDERGTIINLADMEPLNKTEHCSARPAKLILEVNRGWFDKSNIKPGMTVSGYPQI